MKQFALVTVTFLFFSFGTLSEYSIAQQKSGWQPSAEQTKMIRRISLEYLSDKYEGKHDSTYSRTTDQLRALAPLNKWRALAENFNKKAGPVRKIRIIKITWYNRKNPAGVYAAADFANEFQNIEIHCGYLIWQLQQDGSFKLAREVENFVDRKTQAKMPPQKLPELRAKLGCKTEQQ